MAKHPPQPSIHVQETRRAAGAEDLPQGLPAADGTPDVTQPGADSVGPRLWLLLWLTAFAVLIIQVILDLVIGLFRA